MLSAWLFTGALLALGQAVQVSSGTLEARAVEWLTVALLACAVGVLAPKLPQLPKLARLYAYREAGLVWLAGVGFAYQLVQLSSSPIGWVPRPDSLPTWQAGLVVAGVVGGSGLAARPWLGRLTPLALVATFFFLGAWVIDTAPDPFIDVQVFQRDAVKALFSGHNPWAIRYPNIYGQDSGFYGEGVSVNGTLQFGYLYPPLSLVLAALGQALGGDHRYAQLVCAALAGLLIACIRPGRVGNAMAALFLFTPRGFLIVEQGWTEPYVVFGLALTVLVALRFPRALPYVLGAVLTVKQYLVLALPLTWLLLAQVAGARERRAWLGKVVAVGALLTLPFALWDLSEFWRGVVALQVRQPFRADSLSYLAWWVKNGAQTTSPAYAFGASALALGLSLWRLPRTPHGFAGGASLTFLTFFAFNKQAFCNYYYFPLGALAVAAASALTDAVGEGGRTKART